MRGAAHRVIEDGEIAMGAEAVASMGVTAAAVSMCNHPYVVVVAYCRRAPPCVIHSTNAFAIFVT